VGVSITHPRRFGKVNRRLGRVLSFSKTGTETQKRTTDAGRPAHFEGKLGPKQSIQVGVVPLYLQKIRPSFQGVRGTMFYDRFCVNMVIPRFPQVQRIIASWLFSSVALNLQKSDEDKGGSIGGGEIAVWELGEDMVCGWRRV